MNEIGNFYSLLDKLNEAEFKKSEAEKVLKENYYAFVLLCPHPTALDWKYSSGTYRVCMICGVQDLASQGGTSGDEYDYGRNGHPDRDFWADSEVEIAISQEHHWEWRRKHSHNYQVRNGVVSDV